MKQVEQAAMLLETASNYYHESGHGDTAGQVCVVSIVETAKLLLLCTHYALMNKEKKTINHQVVCICLPID